MAVIEVGYDPNAQPGDFVPPPEGTYHIKVNEVETREPNGPGKWPQILVKGEIVAPQVVDEKQVVGKNIADFVSLSPNATPYRLFPLLDACGVNYTKNDQNDPPTAIFDPDDLVGCVYKTQCKHEEYQGETRAKWDRYQASEYADDGGQAQAPQQGAQQPQQAAQQPAQQAQPQQAGQGQTPPRRVGG